jgi:drug/metabolite transporter (DMT)-like permease
MSSPALSRERLGLLLGFVGMAIFGGTLPATRIAVSAIDPMALTALRTAIAGLCSLVLLLVLRRPLPPRRLRLQLAIAMLCVSILFPFLMALAALFNDETITLPILLFAAAVVATVAISTRTRARQTPVVQG